jgi:hypothetical protein
MNDSAASLFVLVLFLRERNSGQWSESAVIEVGDISRSISSLQAIASIECHKNTQQTIGTEIAVKSDTSMAGNQFVDVGHMRS